MEFVKPSNNFGLNNFGRIFDGKLSRSLTAVVRLSDSDTDYNSDSDTGCNSGIECNTRAIIPNVIQ